MLLFLVILSKLNLLLNLLLLLNLNLNLLLQLPWPKEIINGFGRAPKPLPPLLFLLHLDPSHPLKVLLDHKAFLHHKALLDHKGLVDLKELHDLHRKKTHPTHP